MSSHSALQFKMEISIEILSDGSGKHCGFSVLFYTSENCVIFKIVLLFYF